MGLTLSQASEREVIRLEFYDSQMNPLTPTLINAGRADIGSVMFDVTQESILHNFGFYGESSAFQAGWMIEENLMKINIRSYTSPQIIISTNSFKLNKLTTADKEFTKFRFI